jgi:hypothetical protein
MVVSKGNKQRRNSFGGTAVALEALPMAAAAFVITSASVAIMANPIGAAGCVATGVVAGVAAGTIAANLKPSASCHEN